MEFEEYVAQRGQSLLKLAFVLTRDAHLSEDLTQTALATAFRRWSRVTAADDPHAYVARMLVNAHLDRYRRRSSRELPHGLTDGQTGSEPDHADAVAAKDHVRFLLNGLAPRARTVLVLRYYLGLEDAAIAEAMGVSLSAVRATACRALAGLRQASVQLEETP